MKKLFALILALALVLSAAALADTYLPRATSGGRAPEGYTDNGDGTGTGPDGELTIVGIDYIPGTVDDNCVVNPAGTVLMDNMEVSYDEDGVMYFDLGNGFHLYAGGDGRLGTWDDLVQGFGSYPQSDETGETYDPLNWRILDIQDGVATLMCEHSVNAVFFNLEADDGIDWENSNVRSWLNSRGGQSFKGDTVGFYDDAFSDEEKEKIQLTTVKMDFSDFPLWNTIRDKQQYDGATGTFPVYNKMKEKITGLPYPWDLLTTTGNDTEDYVYILSGEELFLYFGEPDYDLLKTACPWNTINYTNAYFTCTPYAVAQGAKYNGGTQVEFFYNADSWLRSPGLIYDGVCYGAFLGTNGDIDTGREVNCVQKSNDDGHEITYGVVPLIQVSLG